MRHYSFFTNRECEYFPCHKDADPEDFNCLFCYCPLYVLGDRCGGDFVYLENGRKVCTHCTFPHKFDHYDTIVSGCKEIVAIMALQEEPERQARSDRGAAVPPGVRRSGIQDCGHD